MQKSKVVFGVLALSILFISSAFAYVPEPQSEGKYFPGKGTKASETYEATAGGPVYDYGKGIQWGPVHFKPTLEFDSYYSDNIFYEETDEKNDWVQRLRGEMLAELPLSGGQHLLSGSYGFTSEWFDEFDTQDHTDHRGTVGLNLNFVPFTLDLQNVYERTVSRANTEFTDRVKRDENAFHSLLEVPFATFFLENEITDFDISYDRDVDAIFDHNLFTVYQRVGYDMTPNTQLLGEYAYINIGYDNAGDRDGDGHQYMFGLRGKITERIAYQAWGGVQHRIYDEDIRPDFNGFVARGAIQWDPTETNRILLRADRAPQESTFDGQSYYERNRAELTWRLQVAERWFVNTHGMYSFHEYSRTTVRAGFDEVREDDVYDVGTGLEYRMPNEIVSLLLDYKFTGRSSNVAGLDYEANEITAGVRANF
jgi:hypothetical protein